MRRGLLSRRQCGERSHRGRALRLLGQGLRDGTCGRRWLPVSLLRCERRGLRLTRLKSRKLLLCYLRLRCLKLRMLLGLQLGILRALECLPLRRYALLLLLVGQPLLFQELLLAGDLLLSLARGDSQARFSRGTLGGNTLLHAQLHLGRLGGPHSTFALVPLVGLSGLLDSSLPQRSFGRCSLFSLGSPCCVVACTLLSLPETFGQVACF